LFSVTLQKFNFELRKNIIITGHFISESNLFPTHFQAQQVCMITLAHNHDLSLTMVRKNLLFELYIQPSVDKSRKYNQDFNQLLSPLSLASQPLPSLLLQLFCGVFQSARLPLTTPRHPGTPSHQPQSTKPPNITSISTFFKIKLVFFGLLILLFYYF